MDTTRALNRRYSLLGWGALFVWIGAVSFVPGERLPFGLGLLGIGVILLGINLARYWIHKIPAHATDTTLGAIALALGAAELFRSSMLIPVCLIAVGVIFLIRSALAPTTDSSSAPQ